MSAHRVNFRKRPGQRYYACAACGMTTPKLRDRMLHADVMEGREPPKEDDDA